MPDLVLPSFQCVEKHRSPFGLYHMPLFPSVRNGSDCSEFYVASLRAGVFDEEDTFLNVVELTAGMILLVPLDNNPTPTTCHLIYMRVTTSSTELYLGIQYEGNDSHMVSEEVAFSADITIPSKRVFKPITEADWNTRTGSMADANSDLRSLRQHYEQWLQRSSTYRASRFQAKMMSLPPSTTALTDPAAIDLTLNKSDRSKNTRKTSSLVEESASPPASTLDS
jgi:hypothetical protein